MAFLNSARAVLFTAPYWVLTGGLPGAAVAAPFGFMDWTAIPRGTRARRIGALHGGGNTIVSLLFLAAWLLREPRSVPPLNSLVCAWLAVAGALVTAWLGGELVCRLGVGVDEDAGLDAPRSVGRS
ncbi:DUF2231 domain-containing protein [Hydrogenophaga pseudoflava]|uniref:DUF2231 domain-containing protein n=1 Tax=Hydrogenophaga pseudoflava TaxID=47421 RepID=UPI0027E53663|nr:DUF2231 domain-containing protein [Hydrogenophaga pseudoflava]MDQ7746663.1 DUF2231 domain-containing protein [Hydrogenophaga pseudoflava]